MGAREGRAGPSGGDGPRGEEGVTRLGRWVGLEWAERGERERGLGSERDWAAWVGFGVGFLSLFYFLSSILFPISNQTNTI
jgi:hypothetical protein